MSPKKENKHKHKTERKRVFEGRIQYRMLQEKGACTTHLQAPLENVEQGMRHLLFVMQLNRKEDAARILDKRNNNDYEALQQISLLFDIRIERVLIVEGFEDE